MKISNREECLMNFEYVIYEKDSQLAFINLNRPQKLNVMNTSLWIVLREALHDAKKLA